MYTPTVLKAIAVALLVATTTEAAKKPSSPSPDGCQLYTDYAKERHGPYTNGTLQLPFQRPPQKCRWFNSDAIEKVVDFYKQHMADQDLARLFENCFPNTADTTIRWHVDQSSEADEPRTFIITGDINAQWMRDSRYQLSNYQALAPFDSKLKTLLEGAIHQHAAFITQYPFCNAFKPPKESGLQGGDSSKDEVYPPIDEDRVWECKFELDSLAAFFGLASDFHDATGETGFANDGWIKAAQIALDTIKDQQQPTFSSNGTFNEPAYRYQREVPFQGTLSLDGAGFPVNGNTKLIKSPFRPSDDVGTFQFFIPSNAAASVEFARAAKWMKQLDNNDKAQGMAGELEKLSKDIKQSIYAHAVIDHPKFGKVFAYEIDGYGSHLQMDDANIPSLLTLPDVGFVDQNDDTYQRTRKMVMSREGNPFYNEGEYFKGIGGPHVGYEDIWPMSQIARIRTTDDDDAIREALDLLKHSTAGLGLMHESVNIHKNKGLDSFTRPWFAWVNTEFAKSIIDLAHRKPYLIFKNDSKVTPRTIFNNNND